MTKMISALPCDDEVESHMKMKIKQISLTTLKSKKMTTKLGVIRAGEWIPISPVIYKMTPDVIDGYVPTKVWWADSGFKLLFYVSNALPPGVRPFAGKNYYIFTFYPGINDECVEYDASIRMFIDQIMTPSGMCYLFIVSEDDMVHLLDGNLDWDGNEFTKNESVEPILSIYNGSEG